MPELKDVSGFVSALSNFAWPAMVALLLYVLRRHIKDFAELAAKRFEQASDVEIGVLKFRGVMVSANGQVLKEEFDYADIPDASKVDFENRRRIYAESKSLMLVHTLKPKEPKEYFSGLRIFDVSVFVVSHAGRGKLNDIKSVAYYFGDKFGGSRKSKSFGSRFEVSSANNAFAMALEMYGPCLCVAVIDFHDGTSCRTSRYLDVEMAPVYRIPLKEARK